MLHKLNPTIKGTVARESLSLDLPRLEIPRSVDREIFICLAVSSGLRKIIFIDDGRRGDGELGFL